MRTLVRAGLIALAFCSSAVAIAQESIPAPLRDWQEWVLHGEEFRRCPILANAIDPDEDVGTPHFRCAWPERLTLNVNARGGNFTQRWQVFAESWVTLPGTPNTGRAKCGSTARRRRWWIAAGRACCSRAATTR